MDRIPDMRESTWEKDPPVTPIPWGVPGQDDPRSFKVSYSPADQVAATGMVPPVPDFTQGMGTDLDAMATPSRSTMPRQSIPTPPGADDMQSLYDKANGMPDSAPAAPSNFSFEPPALPNGGKLGQIQDQVNDRIIGLLPRLTEARLQQSAAQKGQALGEAQSLSQYRANINKLYAENKPAKVNFDEPPKPTETDPFESFGSLASMIGIFGSLLTKKPIVSALNASAAAMKAERDGDYLKYKQAYQTWQEQSELALKKHRAETEDLNGIMELAKTRHQAALAELKAHGVVNGSDAASTLAELGDWKEIGNYISSMGNMQLRGMEATTALQNHMLKQQDAMRQQHIYETTLNASLQADPNASPQKKLQYEAQAYAASKGKEGATTGLTPDARQALAYRLASGDTTALSGWGYGKEGNNTRKDLMNAAVELGQEEFGWGPEEVAENMKNWSAIKAEKSTIGKRIGQIKGTSQFVEDLIPQARDVAKRVLSTEKIMQFRPFTLARLSYLKEFASDPDVREFAITNYTLATEYAKALNPTGVPTDKKVDEGMQVFAPTGYNAYSRGLDTVEKLIKTEKGSLKKALKNDSLSKTPAGDSAPAEIKLPEAARSKLKKGVHTKFGNGQIWTLGDDDEPQQVQ